MNDLRLPARIVEGDFAGWLRDAMDARRMSSRALAMRAGINHSTIVRLRTAGRDPGLATAIALLRVLAGEQPA